MAKARRGATAPLGARLAYHALRLGSAVAPRVPVRVGLALSRAAGFAAFSAAGGRRRLAMSNTARALGPSVTPGRLVGTVRRQFAMQTCNYYDALRLGPVPKARLRAMTTLHGWEHLERARAAGRGTILATGHLGSFEYVAHIAGAYGVPFTVPAEVVEPPELFSLMVALRSAHGTRIIAVDGPEVVGLYRLLRRNEVIGLPIDRYARADGLRLPFFGRAATFPLGPGLLARRTGAALVPAYTLRTGVDRYAVMFEPAVEVPRGADARRDAEAATRVLVARLEAWIRRTPEQWASFNPIWSD